MIFSIAVVASVLSLLSSTWALTLDSRQNDCAFACPNVDSNGNGLLSTSTPDATTISCTYSEESGNLCSYDIATGTLVGDSDGCPAQAPEQCSTRQRRQLKQANMRRGVNDGGSDEWKPAPSPAVGWKRGGYPSPYPKRAGYPSPYPKRAVPSPTWAKRGDSKPTPSPRPPSWKPRSQPVMQQPRNYKCPQKDLAKNPLTDEAIRGSSLFCSYSMPDCETRSVCKHSTNTGLLLEDNDDGNCPQTATLSRPWDRPYM